MKNTKSNITLTMKDGSKVRLQSNTPREKVLKAMQNSRMCPMSLWDYLETREFAQDVEMILAYLEMPVSYAIFSLLNDNLKHDYRIVHKSCERNGSCYQYIPEEFKKDLEIVLLALNSGCFVTTDSIIEHIPQELKDKYNFKKQFIAIPKKSS